MKEMVYVNALTGEKTPVCHHGKVVFKYLIQRLESDTISLKEVKAIAEMFYSYAKNNDKNDPSYDWAIVFNLTYKAWSCGDYTKYNIDAEPSLDDFDGDLEIAKNIVELMLDIKRNKNKDGLQMRL